MRGMKSIKDLEWALENAPDTIEMYKKHVSIIPDLEDYLKLLHTESMTVKIRSTLSRKKGRTLGIHPSSACKKGVCQLKLYYECVDELEPKRGYDQKMQEIWDLGSLMHDRLQTFLSNMYGDQFEAEALVSIPDLHVIGHTDGIFQFEAHDGLKAYRFVLEIKTIKEGGNFGWAKVQDKPLEDNVRQAHFYMKALDAPFALIFYISKNTGEFLEHSVTFDHKVWADLVKTIKAPTEAAYGEGARVKATPSWFCQWCDYEHSCSAAKRKGGRGAKRTQRKK